MVLSVNPVQDGDRDFGPVLHRGEKLPRLDGPVEVYFGVRFHRSSRRYSLLSGGAVVQFEALSFDQTSASRVFIQVLTIPFGFLERYME